MVRFAGRCLSPWCLPILFKPRIFVPISLLGLFPFSVFAVSPPLIRTVVGNAVWNYAGDGGDPRQASLRGPNGMAFSPDGELYIADSLNNVVRKVSRAGVIVTIAGNGNPGYAGDGGPATQASFTAPTSLTFTAGGDLLIADCGNDRVREVNLRTGVVSTFAGGADPGFGSDGFGDGANASQANFSCPVAIAVDNAGNVYISDYFHDLVRKVDVTTGLVTVAAGSGDPNGPHLGDGGPATAASLNGPMGLSFDATNNLYIADTGNDRVRRVAVDSGHIGTVAGNGITDYNGDGQLATQASLNFPCSLALDSSQHLYIADKGNSTVRVVDLSSGRIQTAAGTGRAGYSGDDGNPQLAEMMSPSGVVLDSNGQVYVADYLADVIRVLTSLPSSSDYSTHGGSSAPQLTVYPSQLSLVVGRLGQTSTPQTVLIQNSGSSSVMITSLGLAGAGTDSFSVQSNCNSVSVGEQCSAEVTFAPSANGTRTGSLVITDNTNDSPHIVSLEGIILQEDHPEGLYFVPITPCRAVDTRNPDGPFGGPDLIGEQTRDFVLPAATCAIPVTAKAYAANVTVVPRDELGYLTVWGSGQPQPFTSTLNSDGRVKSVAAIIEAGNAGSVSVYPTQDTSFILDIYGYFVPDPSALAYYPVTPCRVTDTRIRMGATAIPSEGQLFSIPMRSSSCNVPSNAQAYALNITSVPKGPLGYLTAFPAGMPQPPTSNLNAPFGNVTANQTIIGSGTNGDISVFASNPSDLVIDIQGYFAPPADGGMAYYGTKPCRILDTRAGAGAPITQLLEVDPRAADCGVPSNPAAYVLNATAVPEGPLGYLSLQNTPEVGSVSTLNADDGAITSNLSIVPPVPGGSAFTAVSSNSTHLVLDLLGYFAPLSPP